MKELHPRLQRCLTNEAMQQRDRASRHRLSSVNHESAERGGKLWWVTTGGGLSIGRALQGFGGGGQKIPREVGPRNVEEVTMAMYLVLVKTL